MILIPFNFLITKFCEWAVLIEVRPIFLCNRVRLCEIGNSWNGVEDKKAKTMSSNIVFAVYSD